MSRVRTQRRLRKVVIAMSKVHGLKMRLISMMSRLAVLKRSLIMKRPENLRIP